MCEINDWLYVSGLGSPEEYIKQIVKYNGSRPRTGKVTGKEHFTFVQQTPSADVICMMRSLLYSLKNK